MYKNSSFIQPIKELINKLVTFLMDCDKVKDQNFFNYFCELHLMDDLKELNALSIYQINYTVIQSLSFLLVNISNTQYLYYMFSNNCINEIILNDVTKYDDEYLSYYINLLKSLSIRIDSETIQFFFDETTYSFPLVDQALKLYNHSNAMISTVVHNIVLAILNIKYTPIKEYFLKFPSVSYFIFIVSSLRDTSQNFIMNGSDQDSYEDVIDALMYINDIMGMKIEKINYILINAMFYYYIMPILMVEIFNEKNSENVIIILIAMFNIIKDEIFINMLFTVCFGNELSMDIINFCSLNDIKAKNYRFKWNEQLKMKTSFKDFICYNYSDSLLRGMKYEESSVYRKKDDYREIKKIYNEVFEKKKKSNGIIKYREVEKIVLSYLKEKEIKEIRDYHMKISISIGIKVGMINENINNSFVNIMNNFYLKKENITLNPIRMKIMKMIENKNYPNNELFLRLSHFLLWTIHNRSKVSRELMISAKLNKQYLSNYKNQNILLLNEVFGILPFDETMSVKDDQIIKDNFALDNNYLFSIRNELLGQDTIDNNNKLITIILDILATVNNDVLSELLCINLNNLCFKERDEETITLLQKYYDSYKLKIKVLDESLITQPLKEVVLKYLQNAYNKQAYQTFLKKLYTLVNLQSNRQDIYCKLMVLLYLKVIIDRLQNRKNIFNDILIVGQLYSSDILKQDKYHSFIYKDILILQDKTFIYTGKYISKSKDNDIKGYFELETMNYVSKVNIKRIIEKKNIVFTIDDNDKILYDNTEENQRETNAIISNVNENKTAPLTMFSYDCIFN